MRQRTIAVSVVGLCILALGWTATPFIAAHQLIAAAEAGNDDDVFADFDIPKVRENLRPILTANAQPDEKDDQGSLAGGLELLATPRLVDTMLNTMLTPQRLGDLVRYGVMAKPDPLPPRNYAEVYGSPNVFYLDIAPGDHKPAELRFERQGLFSWRVTRITIPALEDAAAANQAADTPAPAPQDTQPASPPPAEPPQVGADTNIAGPKPISPPDGPVDRDPATVDQQPATPSDAQPVTNQQ